MVFLSPYPFLLVADQNGGLTFFDVQAPFSKTYLFHCESLNVLPLTRPPSPVPRSQAEIDEQRARAEAQERRVFDRDVAAARTRPSSAQGGKEGAGISLKSALPTARRGTSDGDHSPTPAPADNRAHPAIVSLKFEPVHRYLLVTDEAGYVKVYPLAHVLLRKFHAAEVANPSSQFYAKIFKPVSPGCEVTVRSGWTLPVTPAQPRVLESKDKKEHLSMAEKLAHLSHTANLIHSRVAPGARRGSVHSVASGMAGGSHSGAHTPVSGRTAVQTLLGNPAGAPPTSNTPPPPIVHYAPASLTYPPAPSRGQWSASVMKTWTSQDSVFVQQNLRPTLQIQAHQDSVHGADIVLDTLYEPTLVSWSFDGGVRLWNLTTGERIGALMQGHNTRTSVREEKWHFYFDLSKHRALEAQFYSGAFRRPPSPEVEQDDAEVVAAIREQHRAVLKSAEQPSEEEKQREATKELLRLTEAKTPELKRSSRPEQEEDDDVQDEDKHTNEDEAVDIDSAFVSTKQREALTAHHRDQSPEHKKGDTFLTDLDGKSPASSHKKKRRHRKHGSSKQSNRELNGEPTPTAAADAAAVLSDRNRRVASGPGTLSKPSSAASLHDQPYSSSNTPAGPAAARDRGLSYSQSQPVLPMASSISSSTSGLTSPLTSPKSVAFRSPSPTSPVLGAMSHSPSSFLSSPLSNPALLLPKRSNTWKSMPGASSVTKDLGSFSPPPKQSERGTAVRTGKQAEKMTPIKALLASASSGALATVPPARASLSSTQTPFAMSNTPSRPALLRLESKTLPNPSQIRGRPRLGRRARHTRINPTTGEEETDSEAEREEIEREEEERKKKSWWTPSNPKLTRMPSTLKKPTFRLEDEEDPDAVKQVHTLIVNKQQLPLTNKQAQTVTKLTEKVREAEAVVAQDTDGSMSLTMLEKRHRAHSESMSDYYNFQ